MLVVFHNPPSSPFHRYKTSISIKKKKGGGRDGEGAGKKAIKDSLFTIQSLLSHLNKFRAQSHPVVFFFYRPI